MTVKLLALAASVNPYSINRTLLGFAAAEATTAGAEVTVLDYEQCRAPLYMGEAAPQMPDSVKAVSEALQAHDGLLLASPEYNWSIPGSLKNLIDWLSIDKSAPFKNRTGLLLCASPSARGGISGLQHLRVPLEVLGMWVYPQMIGVGDAKNQLGEAGIVKPKDHAHMKFCVTDFVRATNALRTHA